MWYNAQDNEIWDLTCIMSPSKVILIVLSSILAGVGAAVSKVISLVTSEKGDQAQAKPEEDEADKENGDEVVG